MNSIESVYKTEVFSPADLEEASFHWMLKRSLRWDLNTDKNLKFSLVKAWAEDSANLGPDCWPMKTELINNTYSLMDIHGYLN
jgi:hypothetical protein